MTPEPDDEDSYLTFNAGPPVEIRIKRSRFIARGFAVTNVEEAGECLNDVRRQEYKATHNCWAWVLKSGESRFSDDGEPAGTAGQPMLQVLRGSGYKDALVVVTRYFGGIKLGTGGLSRAYAEAVKELLRNRKPILMTVTRDLVVTTDYNYSRLVYYCLDRFGARVVEPRSTKRLELLVRVPQSRYAALVEELQTQLQNKVEIR